MVMTQGLVGTYNAARISVDAMLFRSADGSITAQSFPPSSMHVGIMFSAAAKATLRPIVSLPMTVYSVSVLGHCRMNGTHM